MFSVVSSEMPVFFGLLREETEPSVRVVLGHFVFVYIHPYMDGKRQGRAVSDECNDGVGRLPLDGHPGRRPQQYVHALESASVGENIVPFAEFLASLVKKRLAGEPLPSVPVSS